MVERSTSGRVTEGGESGESASRAEQASFMARFAIMVFVLSYITAAFYLVVDLWVHEYGILHRWVGYGEDEPLPTLFVSGVHAVLGAVLGAGVLDIVSFHKYVAVRQDFQRQHVWGYFFAPWLAAVLGLIVFALLQSGLLIFSGSGESPRSPEVANLGLLAIGFLSGFGWYEAVGRIRKLVIRFFSTPLMEEEGPRPEGITERMAGSGGERTEETGALGTERESGKSPQGGGSPPA